MESLFVGYGKTSQGKRIVLYLSDSTLLDITGFLSKLTCETDITSSLILFRDDIDEGSNAFVKALFVIKCIL